MAGSHAISTFAKQLMQGTLGILKRISSSNCAMHDKLTTREVRAPYESMRKEHVNDATYRWDNSHLCSTRRPNLHCIGFLK